MGNLRVLSVLPGASLSVGFLPAKTLVLTGEKVTGICMGSAKIRELQNINDF